MSPLNMVRRIFPSYHYERDYWRANSVRNSWISHDDRDATGFIDATEWEELKEDGDDAIKAWIDEQIQNTSVTAVLIGEETHNQKWVEYGIKKSVNQGNGLVGIYVDQIENRDGEPGQRGKNPLSKWQAEIGGVEKPLSEIYDTHDWIGDKGYHNVGDWVEKAAEIAGQ